MLLENEKPLDTIQRHLKEIENDLEGWKAELCRSLLQKDKKYQAYCETWISICKNTTEMLKKRKLTGWRIKQYGFKIISRG